ncbi:MAG: hypothetical protein ABH879_03115 [archaeon]
MHYLKIRKRGNLIARAQRIDGRILVFSSHDDARAYADKLTGHVSEIVPIGCHPMHRKSRIYGKKYALA